MANLACFGLGVSLQSPFYAICSQGVRLVLGEIIELCDVFAISVIVRSDDSLVDYLRYYESAHHILHSSDGYELYCAYVDLPRFVLALRNNKTFAGLVVCSPLEVSGDR